MPRVSVIIPNYNHARFLTSRLDSVFGQTYQDFEVIFIDDASTDDSRKVFGEIAKGRSVTTLLNETNSGNPFQQWNRGVRLAKGEYVWIAESDDYADQTFLAELVAVLDRNPAVGLAYCHSPFVDESNEVQEWSLGEQWGRDFIQGGKDKFIYNLLTRNSIPNASAVLIRKSVFEAAGYADESMSFCGDWATWVKVALISDIAFVAKPLNYYRRHSETVSSRVNRTLTFIEEHYRILRYIKERVDLPKQLLDDACEAITHLWLEFFFAQPSRQAFRQSVKIYRMAKQVDPRPRVHLLKCALIKLLGGLRLATPLYNLRNQINGTYAGRLSNRTIS